MTRRRLLTIGLASIMMSLLISGCIRRSAPEVTYFSLLNIEQLGGAEPVAELPTVSLGIGPVTIPESLRRTQIVTRSQGNQYRFNEFHRWAGVLEQDISVVIGNNLDSLLGTDRVAHFPWPVYFQPTHRVVVEVLQLDGDLDGEAVLIARWFVADTDGKELLAARKSVFRLPVSDPGYAGLINAESRLVAELSKEIAAAVKRLTL